MSSTHTKETCENQTSILTIGPVQETNMSTNPDHWAHAVRDSEMSLFIYGAEEIKCQMK